jgi:thiamine pyrophosphokinase
LIGGIGGDRIEHFMVHTMFFDEFPNMIMKDEKSTLFLLEKGVHEIKSNDYVTILAYPKANISLQGFKYNLINYMLTTYDPLCISNEVEDNKGFIDVHEGRVLVVISKK